MKKPKTSIDWTVVTSLALVTGLIGFAMQTYSFVVDGIQQEDPENLLALQIIGVLALLSWAVWVSAILISLKRAFEEPKFWRDKALRQYSKEYKVENVYFDGRDRNFRNELWLRSSPEVKESDIGSKPLGKVVEEGTSLKLVRLHHRFNWEVMVIKYQNTLLEENDRYLPPDRAPKLKGDPSRYIFVHFEAKVNDSPQKLKLHLRSPDYKDLICEDGSGRAATSEISVTRDDWESIDKILGPIRVDRKVRVGFDVMPGAIDEMNSLYLRNLQILELRKR